MWDWEGKAGRQEEEREVDGAPVGPVWGGGRVAGVSRAGDRDQSLMERLGVVRKGLAHGGRTGLAFPSPAWSFLT